jgi:hypothetical protein
MMGRKALCRRIPAGVSHIAHAAIAVVLIHVSIDIAWRAIARAAASRMPRVITSVAFRVPSIAHHEEEYAPCYQQRQQYRRDYHHDDNGG